MLLALIAKNILCEIKFWKLDDCFESPLMLGSRPVKKPGSQSPNFRSFYNALGTCYKSEVSKLAMSVGEVSLFMYRFES